MRKKVTNNDTPVFDYNSLLVETVDEISRRQGFESDSLADCTPMSTGLLMLDLLYGGGIRPAWYTHFGPEQSAKTTGALSIIGAAITKKIPLIALIDFEGSSGNSKPYIGNILRTMGCTTSINEAFGQRDEETGKWITPPVVRYRAETRGEAFFDWLSEIERQLPDKKKIGNQWWLRFEKTKVNQAKVGEYADPSMAKKYGDGIWVKAQDGNLQALVVVDSYPAMNPTSADNEDGDNSIALQARMFSKHLPRVKGRLADKMIAVIGINQLRMAPMVRFGNPEVEPGGQALKFNCFGEDTLLHTEYGMLTAKEYHAMPSQTSLASVLQNEEIVGWKCVGFSNTIKVTSTYGYSVTGKPGHKVLVTECKEKKFPKVKWTTLDSLQNIDVSSNAYGSYLAVSLKEVENTCSYQKVKYDYVGSLGQLCQLQDPSLDLTCEETLGELLGWIVSEGFVGNYTVSISNRNQGNLDRICSLLDKLEFPYNRKEEGVDIKSSVFAQWLSSCGLAVFSQYKSIPLIIRKSPDSVRVAFLRGLFGGDASTNSRETIYSSISNTLLDQLQVMLQGMGILCKKVPYFKDSRENRLSIVSYAKEIPLKELLNLQKPLMTCFKPFKSGIVYLSGKSHTKLRKLLDLNTDILTDNSNNSWHDSLPELFTAYKKERKPKVYKWFKDNIQKRRILWRPEDFYEGWYDDYLAHVETLRTPHERESWLKIGNEVKTLVDLTKKYNLVWLKIEKLEEGLYQPCYDACVPLTHTIITNGIVSHNSDCRTQFRPRVTGMPGWAKFDAETKNELEPSVEVKGAQDQYRYIEITTKKNKLWTPNRKGWLRIWVQDGKGDARGFDPFFDTVCYLIYTGQLTGRGRKSMYIKIDKYIPEPTPIKWDQIKRWVLGTKEEMKEVCDQLKLPKPFSIRKLCFMQIQKGIGEKLYVDFKSASTSSENEEEE